MVIPIHIVGYSTGAPLALDFTLDALENTATPVPASLVLISPAIGVTPAAALAKWNRRAALLPGLEKLAWTSILPEFDPYKYNSFTSNAGEQVHRLTRRVARRIEARAGSGLIEDFPPTLVFLSTVDATVSTDAVIDNLLEHLAPPRHELVVFDINRRSAQSTVLVSDPGPLTARLMADDALPFGLTLITNEHPETPPRAPHGGDRRRARHLARRRRIGPVRSSRDGRRSAPPGRRRGLEPRPGRVAVRRVELGANSEG